MDEAATLATAPRADVPAEQEEAPQRILYEMPDEMRGVEEEDAMKDAADEIPVQEVPEPGPRPDAPRREEGDMLRIEALHLEGDAISQLSTSRLLAYVAHSGSRAKGIEWVNDTRCVLVFESYSDALQGLQHLELRSEEMDEAPPPPTPLELASAEAVQAFSGPALDALLQPRLAMAYPRQLYTPMEEQAAGELADAQASLVEARAKMTDSAEPVPEIYREMELEELERKTLTPDMQRVQKLRQSLWLRFALCQHDTKAPRSAQRSNWYKKHGRNAGKDVVPRLLHVGEVAEPRDRRYGSRYDDDPYANPRPDRRGPRHGWDHDEDYAPRSLLDRIGGERSRDAPRRPRSRSASPERLAGDQRRIRGRGSVRAPRARGWDD